MFAICPGGGAVAAERFLHLTTPANGGPP